MGLVVGEVRWRQTSPICDIRDVARDNTPLRGVCPSGIFRRRSLVMLFLSSGVHVAFSCRNPTQTLIVLGRAPRMTAKMMFRDRRIIEEELEDYGSPNVVCLEVPRPMSHDASSCLIRQ